MRIAGYYYELGDEGKRAEGLILRPNFRIELPLLNACRQTSGRGGRAAARRRIVNSGVPACRTARSRVEGFIQIERSDAQAGQIRAQSSGGRSGLQVVGAVELGVAGRTGGIEAVGLPGRVRSSSAICLTSPCSVRTNVPNIVV